MRPGGDDGRNGKDDGSDGRAEAQGRVAIGWGSFYIAAALFERCFGAARAVAVVGRGAQIALMPLREPGSGGLLVKIRNARGDRVIHAPELLRELGVDEADEHDLPAAWDPEMDALIVPVPQMRAPTSTRGRDPNPSASPSVGANDNGR